MRLESSAGISCALMIPIFELGLILYLYEKHSGEKLYQEMTAWIEEESRGRRELVASSKGLTERFSQMEAALSTAEKNVVELQKDREVSQCKLAELQRGQMADKATHTVELKKLEAKAREAFTAKDDLYRDLLTLQKIQAEMKEALVSSCLMLSRQKMHGRSGHATWISRAGARTGGYPEPAQSAEL